jgi:23S rRNA pseudouridine2605 synthase
MSQAGIASRRNSEEMIKKGIVKVNGKTITIGDKADPDKDDIAVNGKLIKREKKVYVILNKPKGIICTVSGETFGRDSVVSLIKCKEKIFPVGRLDVETEGLIILTNDGDVANRIIHPRYNIVKTYAVFLNKSLRNDANERIRKGVVIEGKKVNIVDIKQNQRDVMISVHEGRKHIIKKLFIFLGYHVISLKRIAIGNLRLKLEPGEYKFVSKKWLEKSIL